MRTPALFEKTLSPLFDDRVDAVTIGPRHPLRASGRAFAQITHFHPES